MEQKHSSNDYEIICQIGSGFVLVYVVISVEHLDTCFLHLINTKMNV